MQTKSCPDCGDDIAARAKQCKCGWRDADNVLQFKARSTIKSDPTLLARSHSMYRGPSEAEIIVAGEYPKPGNGMGNWWAKRILRLHELEESPGHTSVRIAQGVLGVKTAAELRAAEANAPLRVPEPA